MEEGRTQPTFLLWEPMFIPDSRPCFLGARVGWPMRRRRLEREREGRKAAFQNRFLAQDIVHDREMASQRDGGRGRGTLYIYRAASLVGNLAIPV